MLKGLGNLGDMAGMMAKAKEMQSKVEEAQAKVSEIEVDGEAGAGLVDRRNMSRCLREWKGGWEV